MATLNLDSLLTLSELALSIASFAAFMPVLLVMVRSERERKAEQVVTTSVGLLCYLAYRCVYIFSWGALFVDLITLHKLANIFLLL